MAGAPRGQAKIWDVPTRLVHWALVILIPLAWWTYEIDRMQWHRLAGYAVLALMALRLYWGFFGSQTARFGNFVHGPRTVWRYLTARLAPAIGHNPLGGWSVVLMLAVLVVQPLLGLFSADEDGLETGPLAGLISLDQAQLAERLHRLLFYGLLALVALHVAAILFYLVRGRNLILPMLTGRAALPPGAPAPVMASRPVLAIGALLAGAVFLALWGWGG